MEAWEFSAADFYKDFVPDGAGRVGGRLQRPAATAGHPACDGDCEKIRAEISAAARRVSQG